ncbi:MAG: hypothetical protein B6U72_01270 [Candidatus Altiarchaeales archaeon ex4484_2]|nr:MAG: hypothetical protein B6U72_01270 [Candidatus Altiarchaeales archaeon ex4484_2]
MTDKKNFLLILSISVVILLSGCTTYSVRDTLKAGEKSYTKASGSSPYLKVELLDSISIAPANLTSDYALKEEIDSKYPWVYLREGFRKEIPESSSFVLRLHSRYPLSGEDGYVAGARIKLRYYPKVIGFIKPVSGEYKLKDSYYTPGAGGSLMRVDEYRYGSYGELKRGEEQELILVGYTRELDYFEEAVTRIYISLSIYRDDLINESLALRITS